MQVVIGTIQAEVSDDGHEVHLPPPTAAKDSLTLSFLQEGHTTKPSTDSTALVGVPSDAPTVSRPGIDLDGRLGISLILCAIIVGIAARRFLKKDRLRTIAADDVGPGTMDEAAFLRRYGGAAR